MCSSSRVIETKHKQHHASKRWKIVRFNALAAQASVSLLLLSAISIVLPTAALRVGMGGPDDEPLSSERCGVHACVGCVCVLRYEYVLESQTNLIHKHHTSPPPLTPPPHPPPSVLLMSRMTAVALLGVYGAFLYFQLGSHSEMLNETSAWLWGRGMGVPRVSTPQLCER